MVLASRKPAGETVAREQRAPTGLRRAMIALAALAGVLVISSAGYYFIEGDYSCLDAIYMTVITVATVGYHVVGKPELSEAGKVWTIFVIASGMTSGGVAMSVIVVALVEGRLRRILGRGQLERRIAALSGHTIVCGYGRMGQNVSSGLREAGRTVVVVDNQADLTAQAEADGLLYVLGDAQEERTLLRAGVERAGALIAALNEDAANVFLALSARSVNGSLAIISRAREARTQDKLLKAGATRVICPDTIGAGRVVDVVLRPATVDFVEMAHRGVDLEMDQLTVPAKSWMVGRALRQLELPARVGCVVVAVRRPDGSAAYLPGAEFVLGPEDTLVLIGRRGVAHLIEGLEESLPQGKG